MKNYDTISETVNSLINRGYNIDFTTEVDKHCPKSYRASIEFPSHEFQIDEIHRFESDANPEDEMIVFALSSPEHGIKGIAVNVYGMYGKAISKSAYEDPGLHETEDLMENAVAL